MSRLLFFLFTISFICNSCLNYKRPNPEKYKTTKETFATTTKITPIYLAGVHTHIYYYFNIESGKRIWSRNIIDIRFESVAGRKYKVYYDPNKPKNNYIEISEPILTEPTSKTIGKINNVETENIPKIGKYFTVEYEYNIKNFNFSGVYYLRKNKINKTPDDLMGIHVNVVYENDNPSISMIELNEKSE